MRCRGPCLGSCHRHDLFFLSRLHIGEEIIGIVIAEADNRIGDANRSFVPLSGLSELFGSGRFVWVPPPSGKEKAGFGEGVSTSQRRTP